MSDTTVEPKPYIPGLAGLWQALEPYGYPIMRFGTGAILIYHGYAKLFLGFAPFVAEKVLTPLGVPAPLAVTYLLGLLECFGAAMLALGLFTRPIAAMFVVETAVITKISLGHGYFFTAQGGGYEYPLLLLLLFIGILFHGSGRCSIDRMIGRQF